MPRRDGTGPMGQGPITGRALGFCSGRQAHRYEVGLGCGFGWRERRRGCGGVYAPAGDIHAEGKFLTELKEFLQARLNMINKRLDKLKSDDNE